LDILTMSQKRVHIWDERHTLQHFNSSTGHDAGGVRAAANALIGPFTGHKIEKRSMG
jgi:hypothetical protein